MTGGAGLSIPAPSPKQEAFLTASARRVCYGGARGGGKSWAIRVKTTIMALKFSGIRQLIIRRTYPELYDNHIRPLQLMVPGLATWRDKDKSFIFANGSTIKLGYCDTDADVLRYQGQEYDILYVDEATQLTEYQYTWLDATVRGVNGFPKRTYLTCNPGGRGHDWVKKRFVDAATREQDAVFIPATVYDNKALTDSDPGYVDTLKALPDGLREAWLDGNWDSFVGQYFTMWDKQIHVCEPFTIPREWRIYRSLDYGLDMLAVLWIALDNHGESWVYKELCAPDLIVSAAAERIREVNGYDEPYITYGPPDMWARQRETGKTQAELYMDSGVPLVRADSSRVAGWLALAELLRPRESKDPITGKPVTRPKLHVFSNCTELIRCLPLIQRDEHNPSDCATEPHNLTHIMDSLRYYCASRPVTPSLPNSAEDPPGAWKRRAIYGSVGGPRGYRF